MTLEPLDVRGVRLKRSVLGYDRAAVRRLREDVADSYEAVWRERSQLLARIQALEAAVARHEELEELLRAAMVAAETAAAELRASAHREAGTIVAEATAEAEHMLRSALRRREEVAFSVDRVKLLLQTSVDATQHDGGGGTAGFLPTAGRTLW
jgi:cell division initiation protein